MKAGKPLPSNPTRRMVLLYGAAAALVSAVPRDGVGEPPPTESSPQAAVTPPGSRAATVNIEKFNQAGKSTGIEPVEKVIKTDEQWRAQLSSSAYAVTRHAATEPPFSGEYDHNKADGLYRCICCDTALYDSTAKFDSGTGWPSFWRPISKANIVKTADHSLGMERDAISCRLCDAHLGHVFDDGPPPTGLRYCMNSVALHFVPRK